MKIATWNVNGIRARRDEIAALVDREQPDIVCLQEIKATVEQIPPALCEVEGYACKWHGLKAYSGVGLLVRRDAFEAAPEFGHPPFDHEARIVTASIGDLVVASVYVPNGGKDFPAKMRFLEAMDRWAGEIAASRTLVVCGDLNVARTDLDVHPKERKPVIGQLPEERRLLESMLGHGLVDVGRALAPDVEFYTWWAPWRNMKEKNVGWRLDYVVASEPLAKRATSSVVQKEHGTSDHAPVVTIFEPHVERGPRAVVRREEPPPTPSGGQTSFGW